MESLGMFPRVLNGVPREYIERPPRPDPRSKTISKIKFYSDTPREDRIFLFSSVSPSLSYIWHSISNPWSGAPGQAGPVCWVSGPQEMEWFNIALISCFTIPIFYYSSTLLYWTTSTANLVPDEMSVRGVTLAALQCLVPAVE